MKKKYVHPLALFLLLLTSYLCLEGCSTKGKFIKDPFEDYVSDALFFRTVGKGEDADMSRAKSKALHNGKVEIARSANSVCQMVILDYLEQIGKNTDLSLREQYISVSTESVSRSLVNVETEEVIYSKDKKGLHTCYAKIKVEKSNVFDTFAGNMKEKDDLNASILKQAIDKVVTTVNKGKP
ncbi:MAG: hypothetical protein LBH58_14120 [Tannerellaceae bacterium]|jgi:hypothetical protein|nr:hypothetical protein [Tannerellaceae bacterium]